MEVRLFCLGVLPNGFGSSACNVQRWIFLVKEEEMVCISKDGNWNFGGCFAGGFFLSKHDWMVGLLWKEGSSGRDIGARM